MGFHALVMRWWIVSNRRYSVACHSCNGNGFYKQTDEDGYPVLMDCGCYRGRITFQLTPEDERKLHKELTAALVHSEP